MEAREKLRKTLRSCRRLSEARGSSRELPELSKAAGSSESFCGAVGKLMESSGSSRKAVAKLMEALRICGKLSEALRSCRELSKAQQKLSKSSAKACGKLPEAHGKLPVMDLASQTPTPANNSVRSASQENNVFRVLREPSASQKFSTFWHGNNLGNSVANKKKPDSPFFSA